MVIGPHLAVTNAHNANLLDPKDVIGVRQDYDLLYFRTPRNAEPQTAPVALGQGVIAYGQGANAELRVAHGVVREIKQCEGCSVPAYFTFAGNAGPGFSGGPVLDGRNGGGEGGGGFGGGRGASEAPASFQRDEMDDEIPF